ncbi:hypothetical protein BDZ97DRAFT_1028652 [Flammula alnicola]|nr:hypothetical protein BDZ97DRAFT_1028652 [Flammula alnicola]
MTDTQVSPISQLLHTLGITREDLNKRSDQMRQFLTADSSLPPRVLERDNEYRARSGSDLRSGSRSVGSSSSLARSMSRASSSSLRDGTPPPVTPVKPEPHDTEIPHRRMDSMEMVIERQRRQRRSRRGRERESSRNMPHPPSPSPSNASHSGQSLASSTQSRDDPRITGTGGAEGALNATTEINEPPPVTPQKSKYYRDHTNLSTDSVSRKAVNKDTTCKTETPTPTRPVAQHPPQSQPLPQYYAYPGYIAYPHFMPMAYRPPVASSSSSIPITPQPQRIQSSSRKKTTSPLPPSSPPPASSPMSSPTRRINLVSSPGPMGPAPDENEYDSLPYKLPPGPYSSTKPDLSYAALVGRAILSSPEHRLTLQEIYDWITIVYPHYKRGETTWMNSIRHVLSTTVCFRKVPRDRSVGRTLWAIYDHDLECFKDGGFKKHLCKDYINGNDGKEKLAGGSKGKAKARKRVDEDDAADGRKAKKIRKEAAFAGMLISESGLQSSFMGPTSLTSHPLFPPTRPTPHHQPYYESCIQQPQGFPTEVIFPPLPPTAAFNRVVNNSSGASSIPITKENDTPITDTDPSPPSPQSRLSPIPSILSISSSISSSSVPELTPNRNSSSPPSSLPATSDADIDMHDGRSASAQSDLCQISASVSVTVANLLNKPEIDAPSSNDVDDDSIFNTSLLGPVRFWGESPKEGLLQPGIELLNFDNDSDKDDGSSLLDKKGKKKRASRKNSAFPPIPTSPTLNCRVKQTYTKSDDTGRPSTPVSSLNMPSTPPRSTHQISSIRTPLSHKGLHMSPTASLAHYKSNLDPPPTYSGGVQPLDVSHDQEDEDPMRTPRMRVPSNPTMNTNVFFGHPVTPRRLVFGSSSDSPFRTPIGGLGASPFRTPGSRSIFDPHDPRAILDDELNRAYDDSPAGIFGKGRGSLLYDSPGYDSPAKWW